MDDYFDQQAAGDLKHAPEAKNTATPQPAEATQPPAPETAHDHGTAPSIKAAVQELLKCGLVEHTNKPNIYKSLVRDAITVNTILEPLDFKLQIDDIRGLAFLTIPMAGANDDSEDNWQHPLLRRQRLTTEQSLLIAILRQRFMAYEQECGIGAAAARIDFDELRSQLDLYLGEYGSDERSRKRLSNLLDQLHGHGITNGPDKENQIHIRPIIVHLANPQQLELLIHHFKQLAVNHPAEATPHPEPETDNDHAE